MSKYCLGCGAENSDDANHCTNCGQAFSVTPLPPHPETRIDLPPQALPAQPAMVSQPSQPQPYPGYFAGQTGVPAPAVPKKRRVPLAVKIVVPIALGFVAIVAVLAFLIGSFFSNNTITADYYKLGNDQIPSVSSVLGSRQSVHSYTGQYIDHVEMTIQYQVYGSNQGQDMWQYTNYLQSHLGFTPTTALNFQGSSGSMALVANSQDEGQIILLEIAYDQGGYTITITKGAGVINR